jgi:hypothetical protein
VLNPNKRTPRVAHNWWGRPWNCGGAEPDHPKTKRRTEARRKIRLVNTRTEARPWLAPTSKSIGSDPDLSSFIHDLRATT